ncbi:hypothetical protein ACIP10_36235 [Streptomyces galbus]|uniref:hypothetical protein n=1 Tax=Streptomyces galbus TaxID=33898 RepID=UPI00380EA45C
MSGEGLQTHTEGAAQPPEPEVGHGSPADAEVSTDTDYLGGTMESIGRLAAARLR